MIDYNPVNAITQAASNVGANRDAMEQQQMQQDQQRMQMQQQDSQLRQQEGAQQMGMNQARLQMAQQAAAQQGAPQSQAPQFVPYTNPDGSVYRVTPEQKAQLQNLDATQIDDPDQREAMRREIIGQPNLVPTDQPDGGTAYMDPKDASMAQLRNQQLGINQQRANTSQQRADTQKSAADSLADYRDNSFNQRERQIQAKADALTRNVADRTANTAMKITREEADGAESGAKTKLDELIKTAPPKFDPNAPPVEGEPQGVTQFRVRLLAAQAALDKAMKDRHAVYDAQAQKLGLAGQPSQPGAAQASETSANPAQSPSAASFTHFAVGPNGQKVGWNGSAWVPAP